MMSDYVKQLIEQAERNKMVQEFWEEVERKAEKYGVDVSYYLAEFY
jgi:hypothetical protein